MVETALHAVALTHVPFEDLDSLEPVLSSRGFQISYAQATDTHLSAEALMDTDLLVVLGGPIGVYEVDDYPFLEREIELIRRRLEAKRPTLGICLGAQLIAASLGARVYPGQNGSELGWSRLCPPNIETTPEWFKPILEMDLEVLHWHGDTFDLPAGATLLASSQTYQNQAFMIEDYALALQFHVEVSAPGLERWYVGHTGELRSKKIDIPALRKAGQQKAPRANAAAKKFITGWLDYIL